MSSADPTPTREQDADAARLAAEVIKQAMLGDSDAAHAAVLGALATERARGRAEGWERGFASGLLQAETILDNPDAPDLENPYKEPPDVR